MIQTADRRETRYMYANMNGSTYTNILGFINIILMKLICIMISSTRYQVCV